MKDDASAALRRIRRELRAAHGELIRILEREMARLETHHRVADMSVTVRNGRYVIPVRRGGQVVGRRHRARHVGVRRNAVRRAAGGGGVRQSDARARIRRGRRGRTHSSRAHRRTASASRRDDRYARRLVELDTLFARARFAHAYACSPATLRRRARRVRDHERAPSAPARAGRGRRPVRSRDGRRTSERCSSPGRTPAARPCCSRRWG